MKRFLLYNIRYGTGIGHRFHLPIPYIGYLKPTNGNLKQITDFIKSMDPDIIGLVEVDSGSFRSDKLNQAADIAKEMKHHHVFHTKYPAQSLVQRIPVFNKQGNAFLTNQKVKAERFHYVNEGIKRLVMELELEKLTIFLVHLSIKFRHRQNQLRDLHSIIKTVKKPVIVAGDFNVFWGDQEIQLFLAATGLKNVNGDGQPSHPSRSPRRQLDYILHSPEIDPVDFYIPQVKLSDHVPLVFDFEIRSK
jgi:endonuclease/exonuclease/phosphatase family metal-dependent hydrolase